MAAHLVKGKKRFELAKRNQTRNIKGLCAVLAEAHQGALCVRLNMEKALRKAKQSIDFRLFGCSRGERA